MLKPCSIIILETKQPLNWEWGPLFNQIALGTLLGLAIGYTIKKSLKFFLIIGGFLLLTLVFLEQMDFIKISWEVIETSYNNFMAQSGGTNELMSNIIAWFTASIPVAGSFSVGFLIGLKLG